jgi:2-oxoglutarate ferredoxin oxidoreductase subunit beta
MSEVVKDKVNRLGLTREDYKGLPTTLCAGCGHNSITNHIIKALFELGVPPWMLAKMSGIGCSSKSPAYFVETAYGFNGTHGRMPALATGAKLANHELIVLGVSGDGDTVSIGLGQFCHLIRRNIDCTYIIEDNGTYGLTKGQFSATADIGSLQKRGKPNELPPIDPCLVALELGAGFVARSFSGDGKQLVPIIKAALSYKGTAVVDVISPCVTYNDHEGSTKSYAYVKEHYELLHDISFVPYYEEITVDYEEGTSTEVVLHDGSRLVLSKLHPDYDPHDRIEAIKLIRESKERGELLTGIFYIDETKKDFAEIEELSTTVPFKDLKEEDLRIPKEQFEAYLKAF